MSKHTPGPWVVSTRRTADGGIEHAGGVIAFTAIPRSVDESREHGESWIEMRDRTQPERDVIAREQVANARLIAAAPDLLATLRLLDARLRQCIEIPASAADAYDSFYQAEVAAVLAQATGEST